MRNSEGDFLYRFADFSLDPIRRELLRDTGEPLVLTAKAFDALVYLLEHAGETVTRAALTQALWPTVIVEDNNLSQTILAVRRALGEVEGGPRFIVTIPKQGYRFVAPIEKQMRTIASPELPSGTDSRCTDGSDSAPTADVTKGRKAVASAAAVAIALLAAVAIAWHWPRSSTDTFENNASAMSRGQVEQPSHTQAAQSVLPKSIAVLPFRNLSPDDRNDYFAAGMHEEILTQLAKVQDLTVIGRTSVMQYAERTPSLSEIATALRVSSVLEGSAHYSADHARIHVRLLDTASGAELWSEAYDAELKDVFKVQADIAMRITAALESTLGATTRERISAGPTASPAAYAEYLRAIAVYRTHGGIGVSLPSAVRSTMIDHLREALRIDPHFSSALGWKAHADLDAFLFDPIPESEWPTRSAQILSQAEQDARQALSSDPTLGVAYTTLARVGMLRWQLDEARGLLARARAANPSDTLVLHYSAMLHTMLDEHDASIAAARRAIEVDPRNPAPYSPLAFSLRARGDPSAAAEAARRMIEIAPTAAIGYVILARTQTEGDATALQEGREALRIAEPFLKNVLAFRVDAALSHARMGSRADAERLVRSFQIATRGRHIDPGLQAMMHMALGDHARAYELVRSVLGHRDRAMDPYPLLLIRHNTWSDPVLEREDWRALREQLAYEPSTARPTAP